MEWNVCGPHSYSYTCCVLSCLVLYCIAAAQERVPHSVDPATQRVHSNVRHSLQHLHQLSEQLRTSGSTIGHHPQQKGVGRPRRDRASELQVSVGGGQARCRGQEAGSVS